MENARVGLLEGDRESLGYQGRVGGACIPWGSPPVAAPTFSSNHMTARASNSHRVTARKGPRGGSGQGVEGWEGGTVA